MKFFLYFKLFFIGILGALTLSFISLYCLVRISDIALEDYRYGYFMYLARAIEKSNNYRPVSQINVNTVKAPPELTEGKLNLFKLTEFGPDMESDHNTSKPKPSLWLVSESGDILSGTSKHPLPIEWNELKIPKKIHGIVANEEKFIFAPKTFVLKLDTTPITYLVSRNERSLFQGPFLIIQGAHTFTTAALAVFLALSISFFNLRRKSSEARKVLALLGSGDLKARFEIKKFDEFGSLILDFNQMANEIERLVKRLRKTEISRSNLLQEMGHDLRTPLTSLSSAFETIRDHHQFLDKEEKEEIFGMISTDIRYVKDLLEKLTLIATIDGPLYKSSTEKINLNLLLESEVDSKKISCGENIQWEFIRSENSPLTILGDTLLITRLFRNALDNASRYTQSAITVCIKEARNQIEVFINDDGPGLSDEALTSFGKRRERRIWKEKNHEDFSLGLGSVIMKTIAQVHAGKVEITNIFEEGSIKGASLKVTFPKA